MPKLVTAHDGDTLCGIAMGNGFLNCDPLRADGANAAFLNRALAAGDVVTVPDIAPKTTPHATTQIHKFLKKNSPPVSIRIVHGSPDKKYLEDSTIRTLNVANYVPDAGGLQGQANAFPTGFGFSKLGDEDLDSFKVEVVDPAASGIIKAKLEALQPVYKPDGTIDRHQPFTSADAADRRIDDLECNQVTTGHVAFRSRYLRLVVDKIDKLNKQYLMVTDMVAAGDPKVEILDQNVRATYVVQECNAASNKCQVTFDAEIARGKAFDAAVRVMRAAPTGVVETVEGGPGDNGSVKLADMRKRMQTFVRRAWAQAHVKPKIVTLQTMDLPSDMITASDATGLPAKGNQLGTAIPGQVGFTLSVQRFGGPANSTHVIAPFNIPAGTTPENTAKLIKAKIEAFPGLTATPSINHPEFGDPDGSCDLLISDSQKGRITITNMNANQDEDQKVAAVGLTMTVQFRNSNDDYHAGHPEERCLIKQLDTPGDVVIDIAVVDVVPGTRGFTMTEQKTMILNRQPVSGMKNAIMLPKIAGDSSTTNPFSLPHELGHVLTDNANHSSTATELMVSGTTPTSSNFATDSKRLIEHAPAANNWDIDVQNANGSISTQAGKLNATAHVNTTSQHLLH